MTEIEILEKELNVDKRVPGISDCFDADLDDKGRIVSLSIYEPEYWPFQFEGELLSIVNRFTRLKRLEIETGDHIITDLGPLSSLINLESLILVDCFRGTDISPLARLKNLSNLSIDNAGITSIDPLNELTGLISLYLPGNMLTDINALKAHHKLVSVNLASNKLSDVSALSNCRSITNLNVMYNQIDDLSLVAQFQQLQHLNFIKNNVENINFLQALPLIKTLSFMDNPINDIASLAGLKDLQQINMRGVPVHDLKPLAGATSLNTLIAGPVENFDGQLIGQFTGLTFLALVDCRIDNVSFIRPLKKLSHLDLANNHIEDFNPILELPTLNTIKLQNNLISIPFPSSPFNSLHVLDLSGNPFGNKLYSNGYNDLPQLNTDTAFYWFERGDNDKALAYAYIDTIGKIPLKIYYQKLLDTDPDDEYFRLYYVMQCEEQLRSITEKDDDILKMEEHIITVIKRSCFFNRKELLISLEEKGRRVQNYNKYSEYGAYLDDTWHVKPHPEMLYKLASGVFLKRDHMDKLLSIYQQLIRKGSPFHIALGHRIRYVLRNSFAGTPQEREAHDFYKKLLIYADESKIPFFDTTAWLKKQPRYYSHGKYESPNPTWINHHEESAKDKTGWKVLLWIMIALVCCMALSKGC